MSPSRAWNQLQSRKALWTAYSPRGSMLGSMSGSGGGPSKVILPAVIDAAQALLLVATEEERGAAMRALALNQADLAGRDAEGDQVLAQEPDPNGRPVRIRQLAGHEGGDPVLAQQGAHRCTGADATEQLVVVLG